MQTHGIEAEIGDRYVDELRRAGHLLAGDEQACEARRRSAAYIVGDVLAELNGDPAPLPTAEQIRASIVGFLGSGAGLGEAVEAGRILFAVALPVLARHPGVDPVDAATVLNQRLARDMSSALSEARRAGMLQPTTIPVLDVRRLPATFTRREAEIAAMLASDASTGEICARLHISPKTLQNHITHISDKLDGRGRGGIRRVLLTVQAVAMVPAVLLSTGLSDGVVALQDLV